MPKPNSRGMHPNGKSSKSSPFTMVLHTIQNHSDYVALSPGARGFLWDMAKQYNGKNNGMLRASESVMGSMGYSKHQCMRYRDQLEKRGWIKRTRLPRAKKEPILYRLAWLRLDEWAGPPFLDSGVTTQPMKSLK